MWSVGKGAFWIVIAVLIAKWAGIMPDQATPILVRCEADGLHIRSDWPLAVKVDPNFRDGCGKGV